MNGKLPHWMSGVSLAGVLAVAVAWGQVTEKVEQLEQAQSDVKTLVIQQADLTRALDEREKDIDELKESLKDLLQELRTR